MVASTAILNRPAITPICSFAKPLICKLVSCTKLRTFNSRCGKLNVPDKLNLWFENEIKCKKRRIGNYTTTYVSRESSVEEGIGAHEQEAFGAKLARFEWKRIEAFLNDLSKWLVVALFSLVLLLRHDAKAIWISTGSILNVGLSIALKKILNQERPSSASKSDPGMPSSHAQSLFYLSFIVTLSMMEWLGMNIYTTLLAGLVLSLGSYFAWLRVSQGFHTMSQVTVGAVAGSVYAGLWFWLWDAIVFPAFISSLWVRLLVVVGGVGCILQFLVFLVYDWIMKEH
ncbi:Lipid phosphate phosphatase epsilon 2, chloroplastic [Heracleum sosnowskyi]|uniref:Lipid phosphate phosphatase epsilon 2, chloroplastic n=1 Tax=Heracleum sosnowskyi TaxID=360622 RepID=A0AAD8H576_9APIA|nr:Lipid phosphate phosphatase epsilon 2, chloroplastic [Heracleum sosnowskyi]